MAILESIDHPGQSQVLATRHLVGRSKVCMTSIDDRQISGEHAVLEWKGNCWELRDLGSRNGTFVDGKQLEPNKPTLCAVEDTLQLGDHVFHVMLVGIDERTRRERQRTQRLDEPLLPREEFEILGEIGRGATGRVYAAHQKLLRRNVAIKVLRTEVDPDAESQARFVREGRVACMIDSPHVVEVFDLRLVGDRVYLVMELVNGVSAKDRVYGGPLPVPEALKVAEDVAFALEAAHRVGVVHRDIKPANILITPQGDAKLSDFGIAKELDSLESLTSTGEGLGTLAYVSPEQATEAKTVDRRTDLYSLGA
ncbi:MAG: protein kinase, partial [Myxococcales bacterium]|nr:protein kinase [Myxococcales bacterium]